MSPWAQLTPGVGRTQACAGTFTITPPFTPGPEGFKSLKVTFWLRTTKGVRLISCPVASLDAGERVYIYTVDQKLSLAGSTASVAGAAPAWRGKPASWNKAAHARPWDHTRPENTRLIAHVGKGLSSRRNTIFAPDLDKRVFFSGPETILVPELHKRGSSPARKRS